MLTLNIARRIIEFAIMV